MKVNAEIARWSRRYQAVLHKHLENGSAEDLQLAYRLGSKAAAMGLETLDVALIHEQTLVTLLSPFGSSRIRRKMIKQAQTFFTEVIVPIEKTHQAALKADICVKQLNRILCKRKAESSGTTRRLKRGIARRRSAEVYVSIKTVEKHRNNVMQKLDIHDTAGLTRYAMETGIIESSVHLTVMKGNS